jgi:hypothetical protein
MAQLVGHRARDRAGRRMLGLLVASIRLALLGGIELVELPGAVESIELVMVSWPRSQLGGSPGEPRRIF